MPSPPEPLFPTRAHRLFAILDEATLRSRGASPGDVACALADSGVRHLVVRAKDLDRYAAAELLSRIVDAVRGSPVRLIAHGDPTLAALPGVWGLHLPANAPGGVAPRSLRFGRSTHSAADVVAAAGEGAAWVFLAPVFPTKSKPGYGPALGLEALAGICEGSRCVPVVALGGVTATCVGAIASAGAAAIAVMGPLSEIGVREVAKELLRAVDSAPWREV